MIGLTKYICKIHHWYENYLSKDIQIHKVFLEESVDPGRVHRPVCVRLFEGLHFPII